MPTIDKHGCVNHPRVIQARRVHIERGPMTLALGIVVHQTGAPTARSSLNSYSLPSSNGAHFLLDRDGTIYQTASLFRQTWHVGRLRARCLAEMRCSPVDLAALKRFDPKREHRREMTKAVPDRYPSNEDSIGIELVGEALPRDPSVPSEKKTFESVTPRQNQALSWLVLELGATLGVPVTEVFRHPVVSRKNPTEAATAKW